MSFPITCTACHKTFTISGEIYEKKVAGRVVTIKCKSCSQGIRVDGTKGLAATEAVEPTPAAPQPDAPTGEPLWAVDYPDGQDREFTTAEVKAELERGAIAGTTLVWRDGMAEWLELHQVPELAAELAKIETKKAAAMAAAKAAAAGPVHTPRAPMPTVTGLAGLPGAGVAIKPKPPAAELPKPRAQQPSSPALGSPLPKSRAKAPSGSDDVTPVPKPRAQMPSAPVLPLPAQAAVVPPAAPAPFTPPTPTAAMGAPVSPFATSPAPVAHATPPLPASVANVVSRPPQPQPTFPTSVRPMPALGAGPVLVADHASVEWPEAKRKAPLIVLGVIVAGAIAAAVIVMLSGKDEAPPSAPISAVQPRPPGTPPASPAGTPRSAAAETEADSATGSDPVATSSDRGATPGAGFAELFAAGARKAEAKGATLAPTARFDPAATKAPLAQAASEAQACKQSGGPTGTVTVVVTFDPNGKVSSATITDAPFAGTATAVCISSALKRASIAPFSGLPGTVSKTFSIL